MIDMSTLLARAGSICDDPVVYTAWVEILNAIFNGETLESDAEWMGALLCALDDAGYVVLKPDGPYSGETL